MPAAACSSSNCPRTTNAEIAEIARLFRGRSEDARRRLSNLNKISMCNRVAAVIIAYDLGLVE